MPSEHCHCYLSMLSLRCLQTGGGELQFPLTQYEDGFPTVMKPLLQTKSAVLPPSITYAFPLVGSLGNGQFTAVKRIFICVILYVVQSVCNCIT